MRNKIEDYLINTEEVQLIRIIYRYETEYKVIVCGSVIYNGDSYDEAISIADDFLN